MGELVAALQANGPDLFRRWLSGGVQGLGEPVVEELLHDLRACFFCLMIPSKRAATSPFVACA